MGASEDGYKPSAGWGAGFEGGVFIGLGVSGSGGCIGAGTKIGDGGFPSPSKIVAASNSSTGINRNVESVLIVKEGQNYANSRQYNRGNK